MIDLNATENFLFVPHPGKTKGILYVLAFVEKYEKNSFVLLPYQNPQVKNPVALFYKIEEIINDVDFNLYKKNLRPPVVKFEAVTSKEKYLTTVKQLKHEIQIGNIYEINYCIRFVSKNTSIDPIRVFLVLNKLAKAPYACLLKTGSDYVICASPELFLKREQNAISTKPIKGTTRRGKTEDEDLFLKNELHHNLKERTENVMAVDVARNDLSHFAKKGTVRVNQLYNIETFETVHQMVSTVSCDLKEELLNEDPPAIFDTIISATFPMASMTGAPKLRAMKLIDAFEEFERKSYSGAMGIIDDKGDFVLSVIIRSIFYNDYKKELSFAVGGAITYLSEPEKEYEECLLKAKALLKALNASVS